MGNFVVTGYKGFIGSNLVSSLLAFEHNVTGIDWGDISSKGLASRTPNNLDMIDAVFHVGANSNTLEKDPSVLLEQNVKSTFLLAQECQRLGVPFIYSSSAAIYGSQGHQPSNLYGWSKLLGEQLTSLVPGVSLRYFNVYGPGEGRKGAMSSFAYQAWGENAVGQKVQLFPGNPRRDFIHVDDIVSANLHALENYEHLRGHWYDIGTGMPSSFEQVLSTLEIPFEYANQSKIPPGYQFFTQAQEKNMPSGWRAKISLNEGLVQYKMFLEKEKQQ